MTTPSAGGDEGERGAYEPPAPPVCSKHEVPLEWLDGSPLAGYSPTFLPIGWSCPADPGHAFIGRDLGQPSAPARSESPS